MPSSSEVAEIAYPYVKKCVDEYKGSPFLKLVTRPFLFKLTRMGIEIAVVMARPKVEPVLNYLVQIFELLPDSLDKKFILAFLELMQTPKEKMLPAVQQNLPFLEDREETI